MMPGDVGAVMELCRRQNERDGTSYGVPGLFTADGLPHPNVPLALVTVDSRGQVAAGHVFERTVEYMGYGLDRRTMRAALEEAPAVFWRLRELGFSTLHLMAPKARALPMEAPLLERMGMRRDDDRLAHFFREL